uniref:Uncharacterized protein n=1 Tax=Rhizophora mucronata TaxID=61149 RepID=A0A2P2NAP2_RHIMU
MPLTLRGMLNFLRQLTKISSLIHKTKQPTSQKQ